MPTIAIAQIDITFADRERNLARLIEVLGETAVKGAQEITGFGGWRGYIASLAVDQPQPA